MTGVRFATPDDAHGLADVHVTAWQRAYQGIFPAAYLAALDREERTRWWRRFVVEGARVHVAETDRVIGFCHAGQSADDGWGEIFAIYVHPDYWGLGHGYELLKTGEESLFGQGHQQALLWVLEENESARRFYDRQGWSVGKPFRVEAIGGVQVTELRYEKSLTGGS